MVPNDYLKKYVFMRFGNHWMCFYFENGLVQKYWKFLATWLRYVYVSI